jgi:hypothetical protein
MMKNAKNSKFNRSNLDYNSMKIKSLDEGVEDASRVINQESITNQRQHI